MVDRIVVHTGFMKTGTTFLQNVVFPKLPEVAVHSYADGRRFVDLSIGIRKGDTPPDCAEAAAEVRGWLNGSNKRTHLYSWEGLVGGYLNDYRELETLTSFLSCALPDAHILLMIRRQDTLIESLYRQSLQTYHFSSISQFLNRGAGGFGPFRAGAPANIDVRSLSFEPFVAAYERAFGADRVTVLPYEWLRKAPDRFYGGLSASLGVPVTPPPPEEASRENRGYSALAARIAFLVNRFYRSGHNPKGILPLQPLNPRLLLQRGLDRLIYVKGDLVPEDWRREILALHAESNRALDERLGLGLRELGYYGAV